jgi:hypothetical protein
VYGSVVWIIYQYVLGYRAFAFVTIVVVPMSMNSLLYLFVRLELTVRITLVPSQHTIN